MSNYIERYLSRLPYPLSYTLREDFSPGYEQSGDDFFNWSTVNLYLVALRPSDVVRFTSALQAGYDILYPETWQTDMQWWLQARELVNTYSYRDPITGEIVDICSIMANCIANDEGVAEALADIIVNVGVVNDGVNNVINNNLTGASGYSEQPEVDALDYVYNGIFQATEVVYVDAVNALDTAISTAVDLAGFLSNIQTLKYAARQALDAAEEAINFGASLVIGYLNDEDTQEAFNCAIFDAVCARGEPYILSSDDIETGWDAVNNNIGNPISVVSPIVKFFFDATKYIQYWQINTDVPDNNWQSLCSCAPFWTAFVDFTTTQPAGLQINAGRGQYTPGVGYQSAPALGGDDQLQLNYDMLQSFEFNSVVWNTDEVCGGGNRPGAVMAVPPNGSGGTLCSGGNPVVCTEYTCVTANNRQLGTAVTGNAEIAQSIWISRVPSSTGSGGLSTVKNITIQGQGTIPTLLQPYII